MQQVDTLFEQVPAAAEIGWRLRLKDELNLLRDFIHILASERHGHATARTHRVDCDGKVRRLAVDNRFLEKQRFSASRRLHLTVSPFADEQIGIDRKRNALQLAGLLEDLEKMTKG